MSGLSGPLSRKCTRELGPLARWPAMGAFHYKTGAKNTLAELQITA